MIFLIIVILLIIIGIVCVLKGHSLGWRDGENWSWVGWTCLALGGIFLFIIIMILTAKPLDYKRVKIKYDVLQQTITSKDDIRDAGYINQLIELNNEIQSCREFKDSKWVGIFQNKKICELELLTTKNEGGEQ